MEHGKSGLCSNTKNRYPYTRISKILFLTFFVLFIEIKVEVNYNYKRM